MCSTRAAQEECSLPYLEVLEVAKHQHFIVLLRSCQCLFVCQCGSSRTSLLLEPPYNAITAMSGESNHQKPTLDDGNHKCTNPCTTCCFSPTNNRRGLRGTCLLMLVGRRQATDSLAMLAPAPQLPHKHVTVTKQGASKVLRNWAPNAHAANASKKGRNH
jgi:hypothetical protein